jgi:hypothetical protein
MSILPFVYRQKKRHQTNSTMYVATFKATTKADIWYTTVRNKNENLQPNDI